MPFPPVDSPRRFHIAVDNGVVIELEEAGDINALRTGHATAAGGTGDRPELAVGIPDPADEHFLGYAEAIGLGAVGQGYVLFELL
jgi:hypothetical protein